MSSPDTAQRAIEWLELQLTELAGIRNATSRDPSFKNWRQSTLTTMQRIWPGDQTRSERFRRIPFSPADPRADARAMREWYSRGCQEAGRVLTGFVEEIREHGVPETVGNERPETQVTEFEDGFPTVDLPAGDLGASTSAADMTANMLADMGDTLPQGSDPSSPLPKRLQLEAPPPPTQERSTPEPEADTPPAKKGRNMKSRLRDLLGFAHLSAKALAGFPRETPETDAPPATDPRSELGVVPLGGDLGTPALPSPAASAEPTSSRAEWPVMRSHEKSTAPIPATPAESPKSSEPAVTPPRAAAPPAAPPVEAPRGETGSPANPSIVMSKPTTLRGSIEKVSIESLISPAFRTPGTEESASPDAADSAATPPPAKGRSAPGRPSLTLVRPFANDPEFSAQSSPDEADDAPEQVAAKSAMPTAPPSPPASPGKRPAARGDGPSSKIVPLPTLHSRVVPPEPTDESDLDDDLESELADELEAELDDTPQTPVDPAEMARATEDFMRSSPVLGATGRRVQRGFDDSGFGDPDAIAVGSMVQDLPRMGVPPERQPEVRARLLDLARRLERGELEWSALRKAVWFAMEYPELARRLMPVLLSWIDRAA